MLQTRARAWGLQCSGHLRMGWEEGQRSAALPGVNSELPWSLGECQNSVNASGLGVAGWDVRTCSCGLAWPYACVLGSWCPESPDAGLAFPPFCGGHDVIT